MSWVWFEPNINLGVGLTAQQTVYIMQRFGRAAGLFTSNWAVPGDVNSTPGVCISGQ